jgi:hypothetical protein
MGHTSVDHGEQFVLAFLLVVKNVSCDIYDLNHSSFLVIETNEVLYLKLNVLGTIFFNRLENLNTYFRFFHLQNLID